MTSSVVPLLKIDVRLREIISSAAVTFDQDVLTVIQQIQRLAFLEDYNTRVVLLGTAMLGCAAGVVGVFTLLRKRALMGDAISHAT